MTSEKILEHIHVSIANKFCIYYTNREASNILIMVAWGAVFLDSIEKRLQDLEARLSALADRFTYGPTAPESVAGGLANIKDMSKHIHLLHVYN